MSDAELASQLSNAATRLMARVHSAVPVDDSELVDLCEQWMGALTLANKYANDGRATGAAEVLLRQLLTALQTRGVSSF